MARKSALNPALSAEKERICGIFVNATPAGNAALKVDYDRALRGIAVVQVNPLVANIEVTPVSLRMVGIFSAECALTFPMHQDLEI